jgi:hypothetical protein
MMSIRRLTLALALVAVAAGQAGPTLAADTATVSASVSIVAPCLTVSTTTLDFGAQQLSTDAAFVSVDRTITYTSCSTTSETIFGRGTGATDGAAASWSLTGSSLPCSDLGPNKYRLRSHPSGVGPTHTLLTFDQGLEVLAAGATGLADRMELTTACTGSAGAGRTMSFNVTFTATF